MTQPTSETSAGTSGLPTGPADPTAPGALELLAPFRSWQLHRVSATTFPNDVVVTMSRKKQPLGDDEAKAVAGYIRNGTCYRCRIGKGRFYFATTARAAAALAVAAANGSDRTDDKPE